MPDNNLDGHTLNDAASNILKVDRDPDDGSRVYNPYSLIEILTSIFPKVGEESNYNGGFELSIPVGNKLLTLIVSVAYSAPSTHEHLFIFEVHHHLFDAIHGEYTSITQFSAHFHNALMEYCHMQNVPLSTMGLSKNGSYWKEYLEELKEPFIQIAESSYVNFSRITPKEESLDEQIDTDTGEYTCEVSKSKVQVKRLREAPKLIEDQGSSEYLHSVGEIELSDGMKMLYDCCSMGYNQIPEHIDLQFTYQGESDLTIEQEVSIVRKLFDIVETAGKSGHTHNDISCIELLQDSLADEIYEGVESQTEAETLVTVQLRIVCNDKWTIDKLRVKERSSYEDYFEETHDQITVKGMTRFGVFPSINMDDLELLIVKYPRLCLTKDWGKFKVANYNAILRIIESFACELRNALSGAEAWKSFLLRGVPMTELFYHDYKKAPFKSAFIEGALIEDEAKDLLVHFQKEVLDYFK